MFVYVRVGLLQRPLSYIYLCIMGPMAIWGFLLSSSIDVHDSEISAWNASFSAGMLDRRFCTIQGCRRCSRTIES